jgi:hypothetical protein
LDETESRRVAKEASGLLRLGRGCGSKLPTASMMVIVTFLAALAAATPSAAAVPSLIVGDVRVTALSDTLLRVEPKGPTGFEDRATFNVVGREGFQGLTLRTLNHSADGTWLAAGSAFEVFVPAPTASGRGACASAPAEDTDAIGSERSTSYPNGTHAGSPQECCALCAQDEPCVAYTAVAENAPRGADMMIDCWLLSKVRGTKTRRGRTTGRVTGLSAVTVATPGGRVLYKGANTGNASAVPANLLHWPSPLESEAYAFTDFPRFTVPAWGPTPQPKGAVVPPAAVATNGYDFSNSVDGDTYIFLLGDSLEGWYQSRKEFLQLTGPTPLVPDFTFGGATALIPSLLLALMHGGTLTRAAAAAARSPLQSGIPGITSTPRAAPKMRSAIGPRSSFH